MLTALATLTGCVTAHSEYVCPTLRSYSKDQLMQMAKERDLLPKGSALRQLVRDYGQMRDACRALKR